MQSNEQALAENRLKRLILDFIHSESFSGIFLLFCAAVAMIVANSPLSEGYFALWNTPMGITLGDHFMGMSLHHWINDVLMSFFFLMVGLEIKRELLFGELAGIKRAAFPAIAALGGMIVPGIIYALFNFGTPSAHGFGIPMATDIAFALGVLLLLGDKVSLALKVFLVSLAVVDDLGAVVVIAIFYTEDLQILWLLSSLAIPASIPAPRISIHITPLGRAANPSFSAINVNPRIPMGFPTISPSIIPGITPSISK